MSLAFTIIDREFSRVVTVEGDIDVANAAEFELACSSVAEERMTIVDLLGCTYMDSTGLGALIRAARSGNLTLVIRPDCRIYRIFDLTGLLDHFRIVDTLDTAINATALTRIVRG